MVEARILAGGAKGTVGEVVQTWPDLDSYLIRFVWPGFEDEGESDNYYRSDEVQLLTGE